jgi:hypothetical protein
MKIVLDEQGFVMNYATLGGFNDESQIEISEPEDLEDFEENYRSYHIIDNKLVKDAEEQKRLIDEQKLKILRQQREKICFSIINRGELWYSRLTEEQKNELNIWYDAWLDVTETQIIPETPEWLSDY